MSRLTRQEVIEHCEKTVRNIEKQHKRYNNWLELEPVPITVKQYWEHKQVAEWLKELQHYKDLEEQGRLIEQKQGQWIKDKDTDYYSNIYYCSNCLTYERVKTVMGEPAFNYCPNCGAKMSSEPSDEEKQAMTEEAFDILAKMDEVEDERKID